MQKIVKLTLLVLAFMASCKNYKHPSDSFPVIQNNELDTVKPVIVTLLKGAAYPGIFESAFSSETKVTQGKIAYSFYKLDIGNIKIESGKLIACDPVVMRDASPFTQVFPVGEFPVHLAMAKARNDERVAFSRIVFSDKAVAKWEFALLEGQKPIPLRDTNFYCYGVDAGAGIFIDSLSNSVFNRKDHSAWEDAFVKKAEENGYKGYTHSFDGHNLAAFSTGYGDGCYATYIAFDKDGAVCQVLTDFGLVGWWKLEDKK